MSAYPIFRLEATVKKNLPSVTTVINSDEFEYYLWIHVPSYVGRDFELYQLEEMSEPPACLCINSCCYHESRRPWYRITSAYLSKLPGLHVYRMSFVNRYTDDVISLFFGYVIQSDSPDKPYIYMDHSGKCGCCENIS
jgi:hypothetical protein